MPCSLATLRFTIPTRRHTSLYSPGSLVHLPWYKRAQLRAFMPPILHLPARGSVEERGIWMNWIGAGWFRTAHLWSSNRPVQACLPRRGWGQRGQQLKRLLTAQTKNWYSVTSFHSLLSKPAIWLCQIQGWELRLYHLLVWRTVSPHCIERGGYLCPFQKQSITETDINL